MEFAISFGCCPVAGVGAEAVGPQPINMYWVMRLMTHFIVVETGEKTPTIANSISP